MPTPPPTPPSSSPSSPLYPASPTLSSAIPSQTLSDLPHARRQHTSDGYRAGLSAGKEDPSTAQIGFDQGYPLGILLGMRIGFLLGALAELERYGVVEAGMRKMAEGELAVVRVMEEMGGRLGRGVVEELTGDEDEEDEEQKEGLRDPGTLDDGGEKEMADESWIDQLPTIQKWNKIVEDAGRVLSIDLTYKRT